MEEHFKNKLKDLKVDWDKEQLWEELAPKLPPQKPRLFKRRYLLLLLLFILGSATFYYLQDASKHTNAITQLDQKEIQNTNSKNSKNQENPILENDKTALSNNQKQQKTDSQNLNKANTSKTNQNQQLVEESKSTDASAGSNAHFGLATKTITSNNASKLSTGNSTTQRSTSTTSLNPTNALDDKIRQSKLATKNSTQVKLTTTAKLLEQNTNTNASKNNPSVRKTRQMLEQSNSTEMMSSKLDDLPFIAFLDFQNLKAPLLDDSLKGVSPPTKVFQAAPYGLFFDLAAGLAQVNRTINTDSLNVEDKDAILKKKAHESPWFGTSLDLGIGYQFKNGFFIKSGLQYQEVYERLNFRKVVHIDTIKMFDPQAYFELVGNDTVFYGGNVTKYDIFEQQVFNNNKLSFMSIPLQLGFQRRFGKFSLNTSVGLNFLFATNFKGKAVNAQNNIFTPTLTQLTSWGYQVDLGVGYQVFEKTDLFIRGSFKKSPTLNLNQADQSYQNYHLQIGLRNYIW